MPQRELLVRIVELAFRWQVCIAMSFYGIGKTVQFTPTTEIDDPVNSLSGMQLMWAFYGYSLGYAEFLGVLEIVGGALLLFRRTVLLGCLLVTTILVNVIAQDIVYGVHELALRAAILYQVLVIAIVVFNLKQVVKVWKLITAPPTDSGTQSPYWRLAGAFVLVVVFFFAERFLTH